MPGPLTGVRVVDVSAVVSGPFATMILAEQGAEVIKVEAPPHGDVSRIGAQRKNGISALYANCNRGKRSVVLDLSQERGVEVLKQLVKGADVFVQNYRPGAVDRMGIGEAALRELQPDLIYVSISGYGPTGPYAKRRVYDPIIQSLTGYTAIQQNPDIPIPDLVRNIVVDKATAFTVAQSVSSALFARERGAGGQHIEVPMLDAATAFFFPDGMLRHTLLDEDAQDGAALYEVYRLWQTADGQLVWFAALDKEFHGVFRALGRPEWCEDDRFGSVRGRNQHQAELGQALYDEFLQWETEKIYPRMVAEDVSVGPVLSIEQMLEDPQIQHNGMLEERVHREAGRLRQTRGAARFGGTPSEQICLAPALGENTQEVLTGLGYDAAGLAELRAAGVIP
jgi:crotonobetainyl-CoA:carnitine CoA-transferase CaiB-like acyl-CoA transferase